MTNTAPVAEFPAALAYRDEGPAGESDHAVRLRKWAQHPDRSAAAAEIRAFTQRLIEKTGRGLQLAEAKLSGLNLAGFDLRKASLNRADLHSTDLSDADLSGASLICPGMERTRLGGCKLTGAYMHAFAAQVCDFSNADLSNLVDATGSLFHGCNLTGAQLSGAALSGTMFYQCNLSSVSFAGANLQGSSINECTLSSADFSAAQVSQLTILKSQADRAGFRRASGEGLVLQRLTGADSLALSEAHLPKLRIVSVRGASVAANHLGAPGADIQDCSLPGISLRGADLEHTHWINCSFDGASLEGAKLDGASLRHCTARGANLRGAKAENLSVVECALPDTDMDGFAGRCASFRDCDLSRANLAGAYLYRASLTGDPPRTMSLTGAALTDAVLVQSYLAADFTEACLRGARMAYARLNQCVLERADLSGVSLYEASMVKTECTDAIFSDLEPPVFADRAPGLIEAISEGWPHEKSEAMVGFLRNLRALLTQGREGST